MATLIANADGNLTGAATFAATETGTGALSLIRVGTTGLSAGASTSSSFTVTNGKVIDGVLLWLYNAGPTASVSGTVKVDLQKGGVSQASVTINKTDLSNDNTVTNPAPAFFKFTSTATGDGGSNWTIVITNSAGNNMTAYRNTVTADYVRALRTTTAATPAAADDLYIVGELTGAGTHNSRTVTMNSTATTAYGNGAVNSTSVSGGGVRISCYGTLTYGTLSPAIDGSVGHNTSNSASTLAGTITTSSTNDIILAVVTTNHGPITGVSGSTLGAFTLLDRADQSLPDYIEIWAAFASGTLTSETVTATATAAAFMTIDVFAVSGTGQTSLTWDAGSPQHNTTDPVSITTSAAATMVIAAFRGNTAAPGVGSGFTQISNSNFQMVEYKVLGNAQTLSCTDGTPGDSNGAIAIAIPLVPVRNANYVLRVNGDVEVHWNGTLNIGKSGAEIPRTSTAVLEFQMASAAVDFGLRMLDGSTTNIAGLSRTSGKNIVKCKLTADVSSATALGGGSSGFNINTSAGAGITDSSGSLAAIAAADTANNSGHFVWLQNSGSIASTTQTLAVWLARGSGTNNRFVRVAVGTSASVTFSNGFYVDVDLQAGTVGTVTAVGNGTATSASIAAVGNGYLVKITGKCSSGTSQPIAMLMACNASGVASYLGDGTQNFIYDHLALVNASSISDTTLNVDTDTGWLSGDGVCVAGTNRYVQLENEGYILNANAGASSLVSSLYPFNTGGVATHSGTSPTQAEVGLITRNVKIRSTSSALRSYVYAAARAAVTFTWAEFYFLGSSTLNKYGMAFDFGATATAKSVTFCSIHDTYYGFVANSGTATSLNLTYTNNVLWNVNGSGANGFVLSAFTNQDLTFTDNLLILSVGAGWSTQPGTYTFNNNTFAGCASWGVTLGNSGATTNFAAWSGNTIHSCGGGWNIGGAQCNQTAPITFANWAIWRNSSYGVNWSISIMIEPIIFDTWTMFGNSTANISLASGGYFGFTMKNSRMSADTTFATTNNFIMVSSVFLDLMIDTLDTSVTGIYAAVTNEFKSQAFDVVNVVAKNCKWGGTNFLDTSFRANVAHNMVVANERYGQTAGDNRCELYYGQLKTDTSIFHTASPSMKMTPNNASNKLESAPKSMGIPVAVTSGQVSYIEVYIRKAAGSDVGTGAFNSSDKSANMVLSNSNLTATLNSSSTAFARSTTGRTGGKWFVSYTLGTIGNGAVSIVRSSALDVTPGNSTGFCCTISSGAINTYGSASGKTLGAATAGDIIDVAIDLTNNLGWMRRNGGNWNGDVTADPATGAGGIGISGLGGTGYICFGNNTNGNSATINVGGSSFTYAAPSGFSVWDTGGLYQGNQPRLIQRANAALGQTSDVVVATYTGSAGSWAKLSGYTSTATDNGIFEFIVDCDGTTGWVNVDDWATGTWSETMDAVWFNSDSTGWNGYNLRTWFNSAVFTTNGVAVRLTLKGPASGSTVIDGMYMGHAAAAGDPYDFDGNQVAVTVGGSSSFTLAAGSTTVTDAITLAFDKTKNFIMACHFNGTTSIRQVSSMGTNYAYYWKSAANETSTSDVSSYSTTSASVAMVQKIEVLSG